MLRRQPADTLIAVRRRLQLRSAGRPFLHLPSAR